MQATTIFRNIYLIQKLITKQTVATLASGIQFAGEVTMIKGIIIVNNHGNPRLTKFYQTVDTELQQQSVIRQIYEQVSSRSEQFCNYVEGIVPEWGSDIKLIYRHYATLYFVFAVDAQESDLGIIDLIQVFVEALDKTFENVCELDLIFHSDTVHFILDEIVMGGMVLETNIHAVLTAVKDQQRLHTASIQSATTTSANGGGTNPKHQQEPTSSAWSYNF